MKVLLVTILLCVAVGAGVYYAGWLEMEDPQALADRVQKGVEVGMDWREVVAIHRPGKIAAVREQALAGMADTRQFDGKTEQWIEEGRYREGFIFRYRFSDAHAVDVWFTPEGRVDGVNNPLTMGDLLNGQVFQGR